MIKEYKEKSSTITSILNILLYLMIMLKNGKNKLHYYRVYTLQYRASINDNDEKNNEKNALLCLYSTS